MIGLTTPRATGSRLWRRRENARTANSFFIATRHNSTPGAGCTDQNGSVRHARPARASFCMVQVLRTRAL